MEENLKPRVTELLRLVREGQEGAEEKLITLIYEDLRKIAGKKMLGERPNHTLQVTGLVNEFVSKMLSSDLLKKLSSSKHLYACSAVAMERLLIDHHRRRRTRTKALEGRTEVPVEHVLDETLDRIENTTADIESIAKALEQLKTKNKRQYDVSMLNFFAGLATDDIAVLQDRSLRSVQEDLQLAKIRLKEILKSLK